MSGVGLLLLVLIVLLGWGAWAGWTVATQGRAAERDLRALQDLLVGAVQDSEEPGLSEDDLARAAQLQASAAAHTARAADAGRSLPVAAAGLLPVVGDDARAVRDVTVAADLVAAQALPGLLAVGGLAGPDGLSAPDGSLDLGRMASVAPQARQAADAAEQARERVAGVDAAGLLPPLRDPVAGTGEEIERLAGVSATLADALEVLPAALGAQGPRDYLLAFQNLAEARPTGGVIGAWAVLRADGGSLELVETGVNDDLDSLSGPVRDLGPEVAALYGNDLAKVQNVNLSPDFPQAALLLTDLWAQQGRPAPDGVVAVDPVALASLLEETGSVRPAGGPPVGPESVVDVVQAQVYDVFADRDFLRRRYLSAVTTAVFSAVVDHGVADPGILAALVDAGRDGHLQVWAGDPAVQAVAEATGAAGALGPSAPDRFRVHLTNVDSSKLDHYTRVAVSCEDGAITVRVRNTAPAQVPPYAQNHLEGAEPTTHRVTVEVWVPPQWGVGGLTVDGASADLLAAGLAGWTVTRTAVDVPRDGEVETRWLVGGDPRTATALVQPLTREPDIDGCEK